MIKTLTITLILLMTAGCASIDKHPNVARGLEILLRSTAVIAAHKNPKYASAIEAIVDAIDRRKTVTAEELTVVIRDELLKHYPAPDVRSLITEDLRQDLYNIALAQMNAPADGGNDDEEILAAKVIFDAAGQL